MNIYKCSKCNRKIIGKLDVHHLDRNRKNNSKNNLICVCRKCHHKIHHKKQIRNIKNIYEFIDDKSFDKLREKLVF